MKIKMWVHLEKNGEIESHYNSGKPDLYLSNSSSTIETEIEVHVAKRIKKDTSKWQLWCAYYTIKGKPSFYKNCETLVLYESKNDIIETVEYYNKFGLPILEYKPYMISFSKRPK